MPRDESPQAGTQAGTVDPDGAKPTPAARPAPAAPRRESPARQLLSIVVNIAIPAVVLIKLSGSGALGPVWGLVVALAFPLGYGILDLAIKRNVNAVSIIGVVGTLLTGGIGLLELSPEWIAVKEAGVPLVIGAIVVGSMWTRFPIVRKMVHRILDMERIGPLLSERRREAAFDRRIRNATYMVGGAFLLSAILNFVLARLIVTSDAGTSAFNEELGKMTAISFPVIVAPTFVIIVIAVYYLMSGAIKYTELDIKEIVR